MYDANQGAHGMRDTVATMFPLSPDQVRVISPYVGGAFGSKCYPHPPLVLAVLAARATGRPVKLTLTREQMFARVSEIVAIRSMAITRRVDVLGRGLIKAQPQPDRRESRRGRLSGDLR